MFTTTGMAINMMQLTKAMCETLDILHHCVFSGMLISSF